MLTLPPVCEKRIFYTRSYVCGWCGTTLTGRRTKWCNPYHMRLFRDQHYWKYASRWRLRHDKYTCQSCGSEDRLFLEVHHRIPLRGGKRTGISCAHHEENLITLCIKCHKEITRLQQLSTRESNICTSNTCTNTRTVACWDGLHTSCWSIAPIGTSIGGFVVAACECECHISARYCNRESSLL